MNKGENSEELELKAMAHLPGFGEGAKKVVNINKKAYFSPKHK